MTSRPVSRRAVLAALPAGGAALAAALAAPARADQPHMQSALDALRTAERELNAASADKGGHRASALGYVRRAIAEVERGIRYDRRH